MLMLFFVVFLAFEYIEIFRKKWLVSCMINWWVLLCAIVSPIEVARVPIKSKLALQFASP